MGLDSIVTVTITTESPGLTAEGFGIPLLPSHTATWVERTRTYGSSTDVTGDFAVNTPENMAATKLFSQNPSPPLIMFGRFANKPTPRWDVGVEAVAVGGVYGIRIAGPSGAAWVSQNASYTALASVAWAINHAYNQGDLVTNDTGKLYVCITSGTSAGSGGPTGTAADITDNTVHWMYAGAGGAGVASNDAIVYNLKLLTDGFITPVLDTSSTLQGSAGTKTLRIFADNPADFFGFEISDMQTLTVTQSEPDPGIAADLAAINLESDAWYGLITTYNSSAIVLAAAAWVEANEKLYPVALQDSAIAQVANSIATDIAHALQAASYARTAPFFHTANDDFADAAEIGRFFPILPGGDNWRMKSLAGVTAKKYTSTFVTNITAKYCNYYSNIGGANGKPVIQGDGKVSANEYIDVVRFRDWYKANLQTDVVNLEIAKEKIPFTDPGVTAIEAIVRALNTKGINQGGIASTPKPTVTAPLVADVSTADKTARHLPGVESDWTLAGAINNLAVKVAVSA